MAQIRLTKDLSWFLARNIFGHECFHDFDAQSATSGQSKRLITLNRFYKWLNSASKYTAFNPPQQGGKPTKSKNKGKRIMVGGMGINIGEGLTNDLVDVGIPDLEILKEWSNGTSGVSTSLEEIMGILTPHELGLAMEKIKTTIAAFGPAVPDEQKTELLGILYEEIAAANTYYVFSIMATLTRPDGTASGASVADSKWGSFVGAFLTNNSLATFAANWAAVNTILEQPRPPTPGSVGYVYQFIDFLTKVTTLRNEILVNFIGYCTCPYTDQNDPLGGGVDIPADIVEGMKGGEFGTAVMQPPTAPHRLGQGPAAAAMPPPAAPHRLGQGPAAAAMPPSFHDSARKGWSDLTTSGAIRQTPEEDTLAFLAATFGSTPSMAGIGPGVISFETPGQSLLDIDSIVSSLDIGFKTKEGAQMPFASGQLSKITISPQPFGEKIFRECGIPIWDDINGCGPVIETTALLEATAQGPAPGDTGGPIGIIPNPMLEIVATYKAAWNILKDDYTAKFQAVHGGANPDITRRAVPFIVNDSSTMRTILLLQILVTATKDNISAIPTIDMTEPIRYLEGMRDYPLYLSPLSKYAPLLAQMDETVAPGKDMLLLDQYRSAQNTANLTHQYGGKMGSPEQDGSFSTDAATGDERVAGNDCSDYRKNGENTALYYTCRAFAKEWIPSPNKRGDGLKNLINQIDQGITNAFKVAMNSIVAARKNMKLVPGQSADLSATFAIELLKRQQIGMNFAPENRDTWLRQILLSVPQSPLYQANLALYISVTLPGQGAAVTIQDLAGQGIRLRPLQQGDPPGLILVSQDGQEMTVTLDNVSLMTFAINAIVQYVESNFIGEMDELKTDAEAGFTNGNEVSLMTPLVNPRSEKKLDRGLARFVNRMLVSQCSNINRLCKQDASDIGSPLGVVPAHQATPAQEVYNSEGTIIDDNSSVAGKIRSAATIDGALMNAWNKAYIANPANYVVPPADAGGAQQNASQIFRRTGAAGYPKLCNDLVTRTETPAGENVYVVNNAMLAKLGDGNETGSLPNDDNTTIQGNNARYTIAIAHMDQATGRDVMMTKMWNNTSANAAARCQTFCPHTAIFDPQGTFGSCAYGSAAKLNAGGTNSLNYLGCDAYIELLTDEDFRGPGKELFKYSLRITAQGAVAAAGQPQEFDTLLNCRLRVDHTGLMVQEAIGELQTLLQNVVTAAAGDAAAAQTQLNVNVLNLFLASRQTQINTAAALSTFQNQPLATANNAYQQWIQQIAVAWKGTAVSGTTFTSILDGLTQLRGVPFVDPALTAQVQSIMDKAIAALNTVGTFTYRQLLDAVENTVTIPGQGTVNSGLSKIRGGSAPPADPTTHGSASETLDYLLRGLSDKAKNGALTTWDQLFKQETVDFCTAALSRKSIGDIGQLLTIIAPNNGCTGVAPNIHSHVAFADIDRPSKARGFMLALEGKGLNPHACIFDVSETHVTVKGKDDKPIQVGKQNSVQHGSAVGTWTIVSTTPSAAATDVDLIGGKTNRKRTIRRRKQKKAKKSKYHDKKKKNTTLKKKRKATKKHVSEKKRKNTKKK